MKYRILPTINTHSYPQLGVLGSYAASVPIGLPINKDLLAGLGTRLQVQGNRLAPRILQLPHQSGSDSAGPSRYDNGRHR